MIHLLFTFILFFSISIDSDWKTKLEEANQFKAQGQYHLAGQG